MDVPALPAGCPWSDWAPPSVKWLENNLCDWITAPANTWSSLAYVFVGALVWYETGRGSPRSVAPFGPACIALGVFSFLYHASYTLVFELFDFLGLFLVLFVFITANLVRAGLADARRWRLLYVGGTGVASITLLALHASRMPCMPLLVGLALLIVGQEISLSRKRPRTSSYRELLVGMCYFGLGTVFLMMDRGHVLFDPDNHWIQGHALWHVFSALALYGAHRFYRQFEVRRTDTDTRAATVSDGWS